MHLDTHQKLSAAAIWIARGQSYIDEAFRSAQQFQSQNPSIQCVLFTPTPLERTGVFARTFVFDYDDADPFYFNLVRVYQSILDVADRIIVLDTDTYCCYPVDEVFTLLERFDFLGVHAPGRHTTGSIHDLPDAFPELNVGFLAFNSNDSTRSLFANWLRLYIDNRNTYHNNDQGPLRDALWEWDGSFYVMPIEFNFKFGFGGSIRSPVRILHGRSYNLKEIAAAVNKHTNAFRAYRCGDLK